MQRHLTCCVARSCGMEGDFVEDSLFAQERFDSGSLRGRCLKCDHFARHLRQRAQFVPIMGADINNNAFRGVWLNKPRSIRAVESSFL
eukprot:CAMPEP_0179454874 /NCGR_PEP_ID=MMETSP0799-20121207/38852_1 /TAXON_ID=46947 /ORGANISM="Geminigera cryophila, Strain CCMP2564" /LENGTH=87 /DNA_ID=CAMNT_0021253417 /DNA_START=110 /DNA_END=373 /DNA_ORIENTATION=+